MKLGWLTDPHLDFATPAQRATLWGRAHALAFDAIVVTGDVGEAPTALDYLAELRRAVACPVYFVLGNHDFYGSSIDAVRDAAATASRELDGLVYLTHTSHVALSDRVALIGHDGWGDARAGDPLGTPVQLMDFVRIRDLATRDRAELCDRLRALGDEVAHHLRSTLPAALANHDHVIVLTHVPPFVQSAWHEGNVSNEQWSPFFVCVAAGQALVEIARQHPDRHVTVLCGHTHSPGTFHAAPNLRVVTGAAVYGEPAWQAPLVV